MSSARGSAIDDTVRITPVNRFLHQLAKSSHGATSRILKTVRDDDGKTSTSARWGDSRARFMHGHDIGHDIPEDGNDESDLADFVVIDIDVELPSNTVQPVTRCAGIGLNGSDHLHRIRKAKRPRSFEECEVTYRPAKKRYTLDSFWPANQQVAFPTWLHNAVQHRPTIAMPSRPQGPHGTPRHKGSKRLYDNQDHERRRGGQQSAVISVPRGNECSAIWLTRTLKNNWTWRRLSTSFRCLDKHNTENSSRRTEPSAFTSCFSSRSTSCPSIITWKLD